MTEPENIETIEAEAQLVPTEPAETPNLFRTNDPEQVLARAVRTADALMPIVRKEGLVVTIQGREHLTVEAWQTLGAMLGVTPVCTWTRKLDDGWEARVEARTLDGRVIGAAEAECIRTEDSWKDRDDFALRSMAQTRATSKALASVLRFVATLGGAAGTPAEEMPRDGETSANVGFASSKQQDYFERLLKDAGGSEATVNAIVHFVSATMSGGRDGGISRAIDALKDETSCKAAAIALAESANEWATAQSDVPADDEGLSPSESEPDPGTGQDSTGLLEDHAEPVDGHDVGTGDGGRDVAP